MDKDMRQTAKIEPIFKGELVIGKYYLVPTVYGPFGERMDTYPVLGPRHEDAEVLHFPYDHYHYDFRFFNQTQWDWACRLFQHGKPYGMAMSHRPDVENGYHLQPVVFRKRQCRRPMPEFPREVVIRWLRELEEVYKDYTLKADLICPHRGGSLRGLPEDGNGCVVCPLHGLRWDIETGRLVRIGER